MEVDHHAPTGIFDTQLRWRGEGSLHAASPVLRACRHKGARTLHGLSSNSPRIIPQHQLCHAQSPKHYNLFRADIDCTLWGSGVRTPRERRRPLRLSLMLDVGRLGSFPILYSWGFVTLKVPSSELRMGPRWGTIVHIGLQDFCTVVRPRKSRRRALCFRPSCCKMYVALKCIVRLLNFELIGHITQR